MYCPAVECDLNCKYFCQRKIKTLVNTGLTRVKSGVGRNDRILTVPLFIGPHKGLEKRGYRIGVMLTNFNSLEVL